jgi:hypothetical protein
MDEHLGDKLVQKPRCEFLKLCMPADDFNDPVGLQAVGGVGVDVSLKRGVLGFKLRLLPRILGGQQLEPLVAQFSAGIVLVGFLEKPVEFRYPLLVLSQLAAAGFAVSSARMADVSRIFSVCRAKKVFDLR